MAIEDMEHLLPHIGIAFFRSKQASTPIQEFADNSEIPPQDLEPYTSGYNLLSIRKAFETWSTEDQRAFEEFLDEQRTTDFFENCLDEVQNAQDYLLSQPETLPGLLATFWEAGCHPLQEEKLDEEHPQTNQGNGISHVRDYSINPVIGIWNRLDPEREAKPELLAFLDGLLTFRPGTLGQVDLDQGTNRIETADESPLREFPRLNLCWSEGKKCMQPCKSEVRRKCNRMFQQITENFEFLVKKIFCYFAILLIY